MQSSSAKRQTVDAIKLIEKGNWSEAKVVIASSKDSLAKKIYHWYLLMNTEKGAWTNQIFIRLSHFIRENSHWPKVKQMVVRAEGVMPENLPNQEVLAWYEDFPPQTPYGMGRYMDSLIIEGKKDQARHFLARWWADTLTSREQQRDIYQKYGGYLTLDAHKKRFDALLYHKRYDNARGIAGVLGNGYPELAEARIALTRGQNAGLKKRIDAVPHYLQDDPGLLYERLKWRRKRGLDSGALEILAKTPNANDVYDKKIWWQERHIMIRRMLEKGNVNKAYELASQHIQDEGFPYAQAEWITGWLALRFVNKPESAYQNFQNLYGRVTSPVSKARAAYWAGRAAEELKLRNETANWYQKAAEFKTTFYGQMARAALEMDKRLPEQSLPHLSARDRKEYNNHELVQVSSLLFSMHNERLAESFMDAFLAQEGTPKAYRYAAETVADRGDYHGAVKIAKQASRRDLFLTKQSYPTITKQLYGINGVEWALVHALIRQESMFDFNAKSGAGALGLMQIMPDTGRYVAQKINAKYSRSWLTQKPKYNILIGSSYMTLLLKRYDGSYPLAIAAYNAGPGRVSTWLKKFGDPRSEEVDLIDWIELIPIYETRNYVQRVMEGVYIYRLLLKGIQVQSNSQLHIAFHDKP